MTTKDTIYTAVHKVLQHCFGEPVKEAPQYFGFAPEFIFNSGDGTVGLRTLDKETPMFLIRVSRCEEDDIGCLLHIISRQSVSDVGDIIEFEYDLRGHISGYTACSNSAFPGKFENSGTFKRMQAIASFIEAMIVYEEAG
jgi:hypothetical protein